MLTLHVFHYSQEALIKFKVIVHGVVRAFAVLLAAQRYALRHASISYPQSGICVPVPGICDLNSSVSCSWHAQHADTLTQASDYSGARNVLVQNFWMNSGNIRSGKCASVELKIRVTSFLTTWRLSKSLIYYAFKA